MTSAELQKSYNYKGAFILKVGEKVLGNIQFVEDVTKGRKIYRLVDFIHALGLRRNFSTNIKPHYRFPGFGFTWADWTAIRGALNRIPKKDEVILELANRTRPEESTVQTQIRKAKSSTLNQLLSGLSKTERAEALLTFWRCKVNFSGWLKRYCVDPEKYPYAELEKFTALEYLDWLTKTDITLQNMVPVAKTEKVVPADAAPVNPEAAPTVHNVDLKGSDGKELHIHIHLNMK